MASFFTSASKHALVRCDMTVYDDDEPSDPSYNDSDNLKLVDRFLTQKIGVPSEIAKSLATKLQKGAWHYDPAIIAATARTAVQSPGTPLDITNPLHVSKSASDKTSKIPKVPFDFFVGQAPFRAILVGSTMSGKTTLQQFLLAHHYGPYFKATGGGIIYISKTAKTDEVMHDHALRRYMVGYDGTPVQDGDEPLTKLDEGRLRVLKKKQEDRIKVSGKANVPHFLIVINDFASSTETMKSELVDELAMLWRHFNFSVLIDTQQFVRLSTVMRANFQLAFLFDAVGYEMMHYEDQARVRLMKDRSAFRDMFQYALESTDEERKELIRKAEEDGELLPRAARSFNFLTINRQTNPRFWYRRNLETLLEVGEDGWLKAPHHLAHVYNPRWVKMTTKSLKESADEDSE